MEVACKSPIDEGRQRLLQKLNAYVPFESADEQACARVIEFVEREPKCFERTLSTGHITASAWLVNSNRDCVLLTHHRKLGKWIQLGGHADGECDALQVALKEAREESQLEDIRALSAEIFDIDIHTIPARGREPEHLHYDLRFALVSRGSECFHVSAESLDLAWVPISEIESYSTERSVLRMRERWLISFGTKLNAV